MPHPPVSARRGFTLIELLVVVIVIGILASIAVVKFADTRERAGKGAATADLRNLAVAQESHFISKNTYTTNVDSLRYHSTTGVAVTIVEATDKGWSAKAVQSTGGTCGIYYGNAAPPTAVSTAQGKVQCD